ncbi:MAG: hypothetical protein WDO24_00340 [Pseudomonadota bacterium]
MVRLFLGFLMLFAVGGAVAGVITYLRAQHAAPIGEVARAAGVPVQLDPVFVPIKREDDAKEMRTFVFVLEVRPGQEDLIDQQQVRLRSVFTRYLTALAERAESGGLDKSRASKFENIENMDYLKEQLRAAANETLDPGARKAGREPADIVQAVLIRSLLSNVTG